MDKETLLSCRDVSLGYEGHTVWEQLCHKCLLKYQFPYLWLP